MKKLFFAAMAATILFTSCEKGSIEPIVDDDTKAYLSVSVKSPESKSVGTEKPTDNVINNFTAFVAYDDKTLISGYSENGENLTEIGKNAIAVSKNRATGQHVYVIANAGDLREKILTFGELTSYIADLKVPEGGMQVGGNVWATGKTEKELVFVQENEKFIAQAVIELVFIASRITVTIENNMPDYNPDKTKSLILEKVAVLNARGASYLFGQSEQSIDESLIPNDGFLIPPKFTGTKFYSGITNEDFNNFPKDKYSLFTDLADIIPVNDFSKTYYYYVFENDASKATDLPTIVTIVASFDEKKIYYPIHLAWYEQFVTGSISEEGLKRGKSYNINIKLSMDPAKPDGETDPTEPLVTSYVKVTLTIKDWDPITLEKEFK